MLICELNYNGAGPYSQNSILNKGCVSKRRVYMFSEAAYKYRTQNLQLFCCIMWHFDFKNALSGCFAVREEIGLVHLQRYVRNVSRNESTILNAVFSLD